jgi:hypothetical protein
MSVREREREREREQEQGAGTDHGRRWYPMGPNLERESMGGAPMGGVKRQVTTRTGLWLINGSNQSYICYMHLV